MLRGLGRRWAMYTISQWAVGQHFRCQPVQHGVLPRRRGTRVLAVRGDEAPQLDRSGPLVADRSTVADELVPSFILPDVSLADQVAGPPASGRGNWAGAPSVWHSGGVYYLAYRLRRPNGGDRGYGVVIAASEDGVEFTTLTALGKEAFGAESLERPSLVRLADGQWRLYVSCATPGSFHWWVDALDAPDPSAFDASTRVTVLPGDELTAVKDPVVFEVDGKWFLWACCHPLEDPLATDRMYSLLGRSEDGIDWSFDGSGLRGTPGSWDARGARMAGLFRWDDRWIAFYDGRPSAAENGEEFTGVAVGLSLDDLRPVAGGPVVESPWGTGSLRYTTVLPLGDDHFRLYYEASLPDGSHGLFTQVVSPTG